MICFDIAIQRPTILVQGSGTLSVGITTLTGASGNGKSTLIKSLAGLIKPREGFIKQDQTFWFHKEKNIFVKPQERYVGYMPQGNVIFPHMSVLHNITYSKRGDDALLARIMERLQLERYRESKAGNLSGGEQQRVALGRALYAKPCVLLLDEPLSALDWTLRHQVQADIADIIKEWNIPCLWVTHDEDEAKAVGDYHWSFEKGILQG
ncbi:ATP-binding cassette domain-containing protein [Veillonella intestinalis]|uniref:ATP-binding cassette domain-containing protein n=1 Tax=Veillonella intestinalis TaxID=2941341 RepID=UPI00203C1BE2|nr:ATP-binding cassette domain-containing protein [Veillonella intestinalis]